MWSDYPSPRDSEPFRRTPVRIVTSFSVYAAGEIAGFRESRAKRLMAAGLAVAYDPHSIESVDDEPPHDVAVEPSAERMAVRFLSDFSQYGEGEIAGFSEAKARWLIAAGLAVAYRPPEAEEPPTSPGSVEEDIEEAPDRDVRPAPARAASLMSLNQQRDGCLFVRLTGYRLEVPRCFVSTRPPWLARGPPKDRALRHQVGSMVWTANASLNAVVCLVFDGMWMPVDAMVWTANASPSVVGCPVLSDGPVNVEAVMCRIQDDLAAASNLMQGRILGDHGG